MTTVAGPPTACVEEVPARTPNVRQEASGRDDGCRRMGKTAMALRDTPRLGAALMAATTLTAGGSEAAKAAAGVKQSSFGNLPDGRRVDLFTLTNSTGAQAKLITYGAMVTDLRVRDRSGKLGSVVAGFDS